MKQKIKREILPKSMAITNVFPNIYKFIGYFLKFRGI